MSLLGRVSNVVVRAASAVRGERIIHAKGDAHPQDLMLSTGGESAFARRMLVPRWNYRRATYTSLISYEVGGRDLVVAALPDEDGFRLAVAEGGSDWTPFARLSIGESLSDEKARELSFSIRHDAGGFRIGGRWRAVRLGAYDAARSVER